MLAKKVQEEINLIVEAEGSSELLDVINRVRKVLPEYFSREDEDDRHFGLCSAIHEATEKMMSTGYYLSRIVQAAKCKNGWKIKSSGFDAIRYYGKVDGRYAPFIWKPGDVESRIQFLNDVENYIKSK